ncbi:MAG: FAD-dependent oxidoreductase [Candidatus Sericytochromatia bacterium]|nr:FAD-dependent oxidoreductase [Candidatus Sericytochromatia bacterium]
MHDFDILVIGNETEGCLAAVAAAQTGSRVGLLVSPNAMLGGLLTEDGLAFVDRDARHLKAPVQSPEDGIFSQFLTQAGVSLVALQAKRGAAELESMLRSAGVEILREHWKGVTLQDRRLRSVELERDSLIAKAFIDATPDADLAEAAGMRFSDGFTDYGLNKRLGISPLPVVRGVTPATIMATCQALGQDPQLEALRQRMFGARAFLDLEQGEDYLLIGPPHLGLAFQRWRETQGLGNPAYQFEADGFNVAVIGPDITSWNGLIYFSEDAATLLRLSREGADDFFRSEAQHFERFLREELGWKNAFVELPSGIYVRQTRHALDTRRRLTLRDLATEVPARSVGTFCYYPDFRGFRAVAVPGPITAHVNIDAGIARFISNLGIASRAAGYTPFAHSVCRLVQYNVTLGAALGVAACLSPDDLAAADVETIKSLLAERGHLANDPDGFDRNLLMMNALQADPVLCLEDAATSIS